MKYCFLIVLLTAVLFTKSLAQIQVEFIIDPQSQKYIISPFIYGNNFNYVLEISGKEYFTFTRIGGNRTTAYNWENNASNAGKDWKNQSDDYMCKKFVKTDCSQPASVYTSCINIILKNKRIPLATIQMCDFVATDKRGPVGEDNPPLRWKKLLSVKGSEFSIAPDTSDEFVYADEFVNFLKTKYGKGNIKYALDNEPDLWNQTHSRIFPNKLTCKELVRRSVEFSKAIKAVDPKAEVFGFASYGFNGFRSLQAAPDWDSLKNDYRWFIDYFLDQMKKASDNAGQRLIDVMDLHWYPEARGDNRIVEKNANTINDKLARLQAPRSLWDSGYLEDSWIAKGFRTYLPLLSSVNQSIEKYDKGMKLAFSEFQYGGYEDITGTIALSDALGIFGKYHVYAANHWGNPGSYGCLAYQLYRNYDSKNGTFGDISVQAKTNNIQNSSIYASLVSSDETEIHIIAMNKSMDQTIKGVFEIKGMTRYKKAIIYKVTCESKLIVKSEDVKIKNNVFHFKLPALSVFHIVIKDL